MDDWKVKAPSLVTDANIEHFLVTSFHIELD